MNPLTEEEYTNIWLRVKNKYFKLIIGSLTLVAALFTMVGYSLSTHLLEDEVENYIESPYFKSQMAKYFLDNINETETRIGNIKGELDSIMTSLRSLENDTIDIQPGLFSMLSSDGNRITIQYGTSNGSVNFQRQFTSKPTVVISAFNGISGDEAPSLAGVNKSGFSTLKPVAMGYNWVAVGVSEASAPKQ